MDDFDRMRHDFDRDWEKATRRTGRAVAVILILNVVWIVAVIWALIQLVQWVTSK